MSLPNSKTVTIECDDGNSAIARVTPRYRDDREPGNGPDESYRIDWLDEGNRSESELEALEGRVIREAFPDAFRCEP